MKKNLFKRILAIALVVFMLFSITACSDDTGYTEPSFDFDTESTYEPSTDTAANELVLADSLSDPNMSYVMVYNPKIFDENNAALNTSLTMGSLAGQIEVFGDRGDGLNEKPKFTGISQWDWKEYLPEDMKLDDNRADPMGIDYNKGDTHEFYYSDGSGDLTNRQKKAFTCMYSGEYCHVWSADNKTTQSTIDALGREFDNKIYKEVSGTFGTPRFVGETGKVNLLLLDMQPNLLGYFAPLDLFADSELSQMGLTGATCNTGHAIVNINASILQDAAWRDLAYSTLAHELQHAINFTAYFNTINGVMMNTWLNEGMSGYIETQLYSNAKELSDHYGSYNKSDLIRNGQSLYNFKTNMSLLSTDVGVYGSVYYFAKYLEKLAGKEVFSDIMEYWRDSYSFTLSTAEALAKSVPSQLYDKINNTVDFSTNVAGFGSPSEEWMSKLSLSFYLSTLSNSDNISEFNKIDRNALVYDSLDGAKIEGGGRVILALSGDTFNIPADSDSGLIYVGLDKDFKPVTGFVYK